MLGKLLNQKSKYYLELSEEEIAAIPEPAATPATAPATSAPAAVQSEPSTPQPVVESQPAQASTSAPTAPAAISDPIELIRTAIAAAGNQSAPAPEPEPAAPTFDYTTPATKAPRRRPGPSMSPFKTMAKDMKKTTAGF